MVVLFKLMGKRPKKSKMKRKKYFLIIASLILVGYSLAIIIFGYPLIINFSKSNVQNYPDVQKGDVIKPFDKFDFNKGEWVAYLFISKNDKNKYVNELFNGSKFKTTDIELLKQMQKRWKFIYTEGDIASVESSIIICNNGKTVFSSGIVLDENGQGLQSRDFGWIEASVPNMLVNECRQFKRIYSPIIVLR